MRRRLGGGIQRCVGLERGLDACALCLPTQPCPETADGCPTARLGKGVARSVHSRTEAMPDDSSWLIQSRKDSCSDRAGPGPAIASAID